MASYPGSDSNVAYCAGGDVLGAVDEAGLEVLGHRVGAGVVVEVDLVDRRLGPPVVRVLGHLDVAAPLPFLALEGSRTDEGVLHLVLLGVLDAAPDVLGHDVDPAHLHVGLGRRAHHVDRVVVDHLRLFDVGRVAGDRGQVFLDDEVVGEGDVVGGDRLAVLPRHPLADLEGPRQAVVGHRPALGEPAVGIRGPVEAVADQEVVVDRPDLEARALVAHERVEAVRLVEPAELEHDLAVRRRRALAGGERRADPGDQSGGEQSRDGQREQPVSSPRMDRPHK